MNEQTLPALVLKRGEDRRLRAGHAWVFSNEVDIIRTPLTAFTPGDVVGIQTSTGRLLGSGYVNPGTLISARLVDRGGHALDAKLFARRIQTALALRERLYPGAPYYRLVFGEADGLPGLVLDRFGDVVVGQTTTAGMERLKSEVVAAVRQVLAPAAMVWKNDGGARELESLPKEVEIAFGQIAGPVRIEEGGLSFEVDVLAGQKTGWFFDQHANRNLLAPWVRDGARVLDIFSYVGAWGLRAAGLGASHVTCVDSSAAAIAAVEKNAALNGMSERVATACSDAFDFLREARAERLKWDVVIVDPPAFIKRRKDFKQGSLAYQRINTMAMQVLENEGILVSSSCSHHMSRDSLLSAINQAGRHLDRQVQVLQHLHQGPDHPIQAAIAETEYLKGFVCRILPS